MTLQDLYNAAQIAFEQWQNAVSVLRGNPLLFSPSTSFSGSTDSLSYNIDAPYDPNTVDVVAAFNAYQSALDAYSNAGGTTSYQNVNGDYVAVPNQPSGQITTELSTTTNDLIPNPNPIPLYQVPPISVPPAPIPTSTPSQTINSNGLSVIIPPVNVTPNNNIITDVITSDPVSTNTSATPSQTTTLPIQSSLGSSLFSGSGGIVIIFAVFVLMLVLFRPKSQHMEVLRVVN